MEPDALISGRNYLQRFEQSINDNNPIVRYLDLGLLQLTNILDDDYTEDIKEIARNLIISYRRIVFERCNRLLRLPDSIDMSEIDKWLSIFYRFKEIGYGDNLLENSLLIKLFKSMFLGLNQVERETLRREILDLISE